MDGQWTPEQRGAVLMMMHAIAETVREAGEVRAGTVYAVVCGRLSLASFDQIIARLIGAGLVSRDRAHVLRWTGPHFPKSTPARGQKTT